MLLTFLFLVSNAFVQDLVIHHPSPLLNPYRSLQGMLSARRFGQAGMLRSCNVSYDSASDRPFAKLSNNTTTATTSTS